jgi:hypothetical protein
MGKNICYLGWAFLGPPPFGGGGGGSGSASDYANMKSYGQIQSQVWRKSRGRVNLQLQVYCDR